MWCLCSRDRLEGGREGGREGEDGEREGGRGGGREREERRNKINCKISSPRASLVLCVQTLSHSCVAEQLFLLRPCSNEFTSEVIETLV